MRVSAIQMDMKFADPAYNFKHAEELIREAAASKPDVIVLPETWNTGFFPKENLKELSDKDGAAVKDMCSALARELNVNIVAGSVSNVKNDKVYNTAYVFDRQGACIAEYDKTHLFTPMGEHDYYEAGTHVTTFELDGKKCGIIICYDVRFLELVRTLALTGPPENVRKPPVLCGQADRHGCTDHSLRPPHGGPFDRKPDVRRRLQLLRYGGHDGVRGFVPYLRSLGQSDRGCRRL